MINNGIAETSIVENKKKRRMGKFIIGTALVLIIIALAMELRRML